MIKTNLARFDICPECKNQFTICSDCDRGNVYCSATCSFFVRKKRNKLAAQRYQSTKNGRHHHAKRQSLYRARLRDKKQIVTHVGSQTPFSCGSLSVSMKTKPAHQQTLGIAAKIHCGFCGKTCSNFVRRHFLVKKRSDKIKTSSTRPQAP